MSGNGGHQSSPQAATSGAPPFDPGPEPIQNPQENERRHSLTQETIETSRAVRLIEPTGIFSEPDKKANDVQMQDLSSTASRAKQSSGFFSIATRSAWPMGINQPWSSVSPIPDDQTGRQEPGGNPATNKAVKARSLDLANLITPRKPEEPAVKTVLAASNKPSKTSQTGKKRVSGSQEPGKKSAKVGERDSSHGFSEREPSLGEIMHQMNKGHRPDGNSQENTQEFMEVEGTEQDKQTTDEGWEEDDDYFSDGMMEDTEEMEEQVTAVARGSNGNTNVAGNDMNERSSATAGRRDKLQGTDFIQASNLVSKPNGTTQATLTNPCTNSKLLYTSKGVNLEPLYQKNVTTIKTFEQNALRNAMANSNKTNVPHKLDIATATAPQVIMGSQGTNSEETAPTFKVSPEKTAEQSRPFYTYTFELSFHQPLTTEPNASKKKNFNVPECFRQFFKELRTASPEVLLLPYNDSGTPISTEEQLPEDDIETYNKYFYKHTLSQAGRLTGMCLIMMPHTWLQLKNNRTTFFKWLQDRKVFMKYVAFKVDQLSAAGWVFGVPPQIYYEKTRLSKNSKNA